MGFMEKIWMDGMKRYEYSLYQILVREDCNRIIDLGCGDGFHLFHFKKVGYETFGIERNKKACETAKHYGFHVMSNNISEIRHSSESFDIVRMMGVLEHIHNPVQYLKEIHNILKKDGELIIATPDIRNPWIKIFGKKSILLTDRTHLYIFRIIIFLHYYANLDLTKVR